MTDVTAGRFRHIWTLEWKFDYNSLFGVFMIKERIITAAERALYQKLSECSLKEKEYEDEL
jgi:hypothetical protein